MEAIRQTVTVKNHKISITLPEDFMSEEVDVIILPSQNNDFRRSDECSSNDDSGSDSSSCDSSSNND